MKKKIFYILTLLVIVSLITVISIGATKGTAKPKKIFCLLDTVLESNDGQDNFTWEWRKITGMGMEISKPPHNVYPDKFKIQFGSGDLPDIAEMQTGDYVATAKSGNLIPLNTFIENSKNFKSVDPDVLNAYKLRDGKIYATPLNRGGGCVAYMRQDWLTKLGLKAPTSYAELYEVLKAFTNNDPDGNGKKDTIGYTLAMKVAPAEVDYYNRLIMQDAWFFFTAKGDTWVDGFTQPEFKAALQRFKTLYDEKLIDQEIFTNTTSAARTKIYDGQVGVFEYWTGSWAKNIKDSVKAKNKAADVQPFAPIKEAKYFNRVSPCFGITKKCKNPQAVFDNFNDLMWDKGRGQMLFTYGVEGVHYNKLPNGKIQMLPSMSNPKNPFQKAYIDPQLAINDFPVMYTLEPEMEKSIKIHKANAVQLKIPEGKENFQKYAGDISNLKLEIFSKILSGKISIDDGLKQYSDKAKALKIEEQLKELNS